MVKCSEDTTMARHRAPAGTAEHAAGSGGDDFRSGGSQALQLEVQVARAALAGATGQRSPAVDRDHAEPLIRSGFSGLTRSGPSQMKPSDAPRQGGAGGFFSPPDRRYSPPLHLQISSPRPRCELQRKRSRSSDRTGADCPGIQNLEGRGDLDACHVLTEKKTIPVPGTYETGEFGVAGDV
jgi:hypothetical protein